MFEALDGAPSRDVLCLNGRSVLRLTGEFWTARQRQACSLHEISYRACFKPQLPRYFIERLTQPGDVVYDPFSGRGTTAIEAALLGRRVIANDVNPLSAILTAPRLQPPSPTAVAERLARIPKSARRAEIDLSMFFHPDTEREIVGLRDYLAARQQAGEEDDVDAWIRMTATNRLTGHSRGFFSVYTLPPNQAASPERQRRINARLNQQPEYRDTRAIILRKTTSLVRGLTEIQRANLRSASESALLLTGDARRTPDIPDASVQLTVTSPPFLDVVQYAEDNWLRCWFNGIIADEIAQRITLARTLEAWSAVMRELFVELYRITRPGGWVAFEVGEVRGGRVRLDEHVAPLGEAAGFACVAILINRQRFTKTANIWGIANNTRGTNTNRIVVFRKE
ncbi:MAG: DNA methyltransferase [Candidatus Brachytrichaceae bacterium NZ_4S206]|jgi:hypothetical protein